MLLWKPLAILIFFMLIFCFNMPLILFTTSGGAEQMLHQARFSTEYLSLAQDDEGVDVKVRDRLTGAVYTIRAKYLIGADGARSKVAEDIGLPMEGAMDMAGA